MTDDATRNIQFVLQVQPSPDLDVLCQTVEAVLRRFRLRRAAVTVTIVDDDGMRKVHKQYLNKRSTTDVISFDLTDEFETKRVFDLVVNADMAARQARKRGHNTTAELALYITHGLLHNLGFDDAAPDEAIRMHKTEDAILKKLGLGEIYFDGRKNPEP